MTPTTALQALDAAFNAEIALVSRVEYNSNEICRHFFVNLRKAFFAALSAPAQDAPGTDTAALALAAEIVQALLADEKDGGYDLTAGLFGMNFSRMVRRWAELEVKDAAQANLWQDAAATVPDGLPMQPVVIAPDGVVRFRENRYVSTMLEHSRAAGYGLNEMAAEDFCNDERMQLAQLIGYSVSGYGELSYVTDESYEQAAQASERLTNPGAATPPAAPQAEQGRAVADLYAELLSICIAADAGGGGFVSTDRIREAIGSGYGPAWKVVPVAPTPEMLAASWAKPLDSRFIFTDHEEHIAAAWAAMLDAAPTPAHPVAAPQAVPLTDAQIDAAVVAWFSFSGQKGSPFHERMRAAFAAAGITPAGTTPKEQQ